MPKSIPFVICCKRVNNACRRSMKGKRNEMQRQNLGALIGKRITENDYIYTKCILEYQRGHFQKKLPLPGCSLSPDNDIFICEAIQTTIVAFVILKNHLKLIS